MKLNDEQRDMALNRYGYGSWDAPYWFLGTEEESHNDESSELVERIAIWRQRGCRDLDDSLLFDAELTRYLKQRNKMQGENAIQHPTWMKMQLLLRGYLGIPEDKLDHKSRLLFQNEKWGRQPGETCLVNLSGLACTSANYDVPNDLYREERIKVLYNKISSCQPKFVVMYGKSYKDSWEKISGWADKMPSADTVFAKFRRSETTIFAITPHPSAFGPTNNDWSELGELLRRLVSAMG